MIELHDVTKRYGRATVLDSVSFTARPGAVTGFLGPNGAGKSTALRILCGLARADAGTATVLGRAFAELPAPAHTVGVLLDATAQHRGRTGRETLDLTARALRLGPTRVDDVLDLVGLTAAEARRRVGAYSLGMRQRLGLAHALLADPEVLVLDEPVNGLDPAGIRWMRDLLRGHADRGGTVLLSSHLLQEVQQVADHVVVIGTGRVRAAGRLDEIAATGSTVVGSPTPERLTAALHAAGLDAAPAPGGRVRSTATPAEVGAAACAAGVALDLLHVDQGTSLEDVFFDLTADGSRDALPAGHGPAAGHGPGGAASAMTVDLTMQETQR